VVAELFYGVLFACAACGIGLRHAFLL